MGLIDVLNGMQNGPRGQRDPTTAPSTGSGGMSPITMAILGLLAYKAMKSLGGDGDIVRKAGVSVEDALRYVLSLPISTLISGMDSEKILDQNLKIVREFKPLTPEERAATEQKTLALAGDGRFELFKSSKMFDGPVHRKQHGFDTGIS